MKPGRSCPLHYRYSPEDLARDTVFNADCLYVVGGLYGNLPALETILELAAHEPQPVRIVFNGDFNWFNVDPAGLADINRRVLEHTALRGNVETELACDDSAAGCGCGYPEFVSDIEVERSNHIMEALRNTARAFPDLRRQLGALPMHAAVQVDSIRIAIVHGDCESLAGWGLSSEARADADHHARVQRWFAQTGARVIASSHSCLPVMLKVDTTRGACVAINNGAAGMPNFHGTRYGVITRIARRPSEQVQPLYTARIDGVHVEALPVHYDHERWQRDFLTNWPAGSSAHDSYYSRITQGPGYTVDEATGQTALAAQAEQGY